MVHVLETNVLPLMLRLYSTVFAEVAVDGFFQLADVHHT
jgi:hypothetical protein